MALSYVDSDDFDSQVDSRQRLALFDDTDEGDGSNYNAALFTRACELASSKALAACMQAGYKPAEATTDDMVKNVALAFLIYSAYGRKQRVVPEAVAMFYASLPEAVRTGDLPLTSESISNVVEALGGVDFTDTSDTSDVSTGSVTITRDPVMRNLANKM